MSNFTTGINGTMKYIVQEETSVVQVAAKFLNDGVSVKDIMNANKLNDDKLEEGQVLYIPVKFSK